MRQSHRLKAEGVLSDGNIMIRNQQKGKLAIRISYTPHYNNTLEISVSRDAPDEDHLGLSSNLLGNFSYEIYLQIFQNLVIQ
jgi:hypothetical protein